MAMATGLTRSGSAATTSTAKPSGTVIFRAAVCGSRGSLGGRSCRCGICVSAARAATGTPSSAVASSPAATVRAAMTLAASLRAAMIRAGDDVNRVAMARFPGWPWKKPSGRSSRSDE